MCTINKILLVISAVICSHLPVSGQILKGVAYKDGSREQQQVQLLIDGSIRQAERMLIKQGAYSPYAAALTVNDSIVIVDPYSNTKDKTLIREVADLKSLLKAGADKDMYKAVVVFFDVTVTDPETNQPVDAIAAIAEQMSNNHSYTVYFPYRKTGGDAITYSRSIAGDVGDGEIFTKVSKN